MTATATDLDLGALEALDFEYTPECEHSRHEWDKRFHDDGPALWMQVGTPLRCGHSIPELAVCQAWKLRLSMGIGKFRCVECGRLATERDLEIVRFIPLTSTGA